MAASERGSLRRFGVSQSGRKAARSAGACSPASWPPLWRPSASRSTGWRGRPPGSPGPPSWPVPPTRGWWPSSPRARRAPRCRAAAGAARRGAAGPARAASADRRAVRAVGGPRLGVPLPARAHCAGVHGRRPAGGVRGARRSPGRGACPGRAGAALSTPVPSGDLDAIAALPDRLRETDACGCTDAVAWAADAAAQRLARADLDACRRQYLHRDPNDGNDAPIDPNGQAFPVIVFSHGSTNRLRPHAGADRRAGSVVAAPYHINNTQDDARSISKRAPSSRAATIGLRRVPGPASRSA